MAIIDFFKSASSVAETIGLIAALVTLTDKRTGYWGFFILFLSLTIGVEITGFYFRHFLEKSNQTVYNLFMIYQSVFYTFLFIRFDDSVKIRKWIIACWIFFMIFLFSEQIIILATTEIPKYRGYAMYSRVLMSTLVTIYSCVFYFSLLKSHKIDSPLKYPHFWIITGLFFFYFGSLPIFASYLFVARAKLVGYAGFFSLVMGCLSCILYGSWIIGFIWKRKQMI